MDDTQPNFKDVRFAADELVVHEKALDQVRKTLTRGGISVEVADKIPGGFLRLQLRQAKRRATREDVLVQRALELLRGQSLDGRTLAEPNHIHGCPQMRGGQYVVPEPRARRDVTFVPSPVGAGVNVAVLDTAFAPFAPLSQAFSPTLTMPQLGTTTSPAELYPAAGHSTFVVGQLLRVAPGANVTPIEVLNPYGECSDTDLATALAGIADDVHLINLSLGTFTETDALPHVLEVALERFRDRTVVVAAAGNDDSARPWFPAAADDLTISAGAVVRVDHRWARAAFSNYGAWIDFCAPGIVSGPFVEWSDQPQPYGGWAAWAGTSFTTPLVTGAIAALMSLQEPKSPFDAVATLRLMHEAAPGDFANAKVITPPLLWGDAP